MARPILPWRFPSEHWPGAGKQVWIRRLPWYDKPVLAFFNGEGLFFPTVTIHSDPPSTFDPEITWQDVHTWKFRYLADEQAAFPPD